MRKRNSSEVASISILPCPGRFVCTTCSAEVKQPQVRHTCHGEMRFLQVCYEAQLHNKLGNLLCGDSKNMDEDF